MRKDLASQASLKDHMTTHAKDRFKICGICQAQFTSMQKLEVHIERRHEGDQDFGDKCNINIPDTERLEEYIARHPNRPDLVCDHCEILFSTKSYLESHLRLSMTRGRTSAKSAIKPITTEVNYRNTRKGVMNRSLICAISRIAINTSIILEASGSTNSHTTLRQVTSTICEKNYESHTSPDIHMREHKGDTPYLCTFPRCGMAYVEKTRFIHHFRGHSEVRCRLFPKYFDTSMARTEHKMVCLRYECR